MAGSDDIWLRRQRALAQFSTGALAAHDIEGLLSEACRLIAEGTDSPIAKVLKLCDGGGELLLCAAHGIPPEVAQAGRTRLKGETKSAAGYAITTGKPVLSHIPRESRFEAGDVVKAMNVCYSINVIIRCDEAAYGALEADRTDERPYTESDIDFLQTYANVVGAAIVNHRRAQRIGGLLETQRLLFRELQHRVKNDLQIILILIELQQRRVTGDEARRHLDIILGRIDALRLIHERMFAGETIDRVNLAEYLDLLAATRFRMHGLGSRIRLKTDITPVAVDHDRAVSLGLIANEFMTNSLKHAFPDGSGTISITGRMLGAERVLLIFADDGRGRPPLAEGRESGTGLKLIDMLSRQIAAEPIWRIDAGTRLELTFALGSGRR